MEEAERGRPDGRCEVGEVSVSTAGSLLVSLQTNPKMGINSKNDAMRWKRREWNEGCSPYPRVVYGRTLTAIGLDL